MDSPSSNFAAQLAVLQSEVDALQQNVGALNGLSGALARNVQSTDQLVAQLKDKADRDEKMREDIHSLATSMSNHHVVLFGPQGSHKMGVVSDVSVLMAAYNQSIGGWKVAAFAVSVGPTIAAIVAWALQHFVPIPHP